jgi:hypothetical protein
LNEDDEAALLRVTNNGFDWQQILQSTSRSREINSAYLKNIETDAEVAEAYNILMDWMDN